MRTPGTCADPSQSQDTQTWDTTRPQPVTGHTDLGHALLQLREEARRVHASELVVERPLRRRIPALEQRNPKLHGVVEDLPSRPGLQQHSATCVSASSVISVTKVSYNKPKNKIYKFHHPSPPVDSLGQ